MPRSKDENLLVGTNTADDAGVYRLSRDQALVYTVDVLTPTVRDPRIFGQIVAANCISDIYAMGGDPLLALNIMGFPLQGEPEIMGEMLLGGHQKAQEAQVLIIGGHTFTTKEIKYGLSVVGFIHPDRVITNAAAKVGDVIMITKPIGVGTMIQAMLLEKTRPQDFEPVISAMITLNREASRAMRQVETHAATDVTGFGLIGHLTEMAEASRVGIELEASKIPLHEGALRALQSGVSEPGIAMNLTSFSGKTILEGADEERVKLFFGSETSGGLLIVLPEDQRRAFMRLYSDSAPVIGRVTSEHIGKVVVKP